MKRILLSVSLLVCTYFSFSQTTSSRCPIDIKSNQGGGGCDPFVDANGNTLKGTAVVTLTFATDVTCAPRLLAVRDKDGQRRVLLSGIGVIDKNKANEVSYCLYGESSNDNFFNQPNLIAELQYNCPGVFVGVVYCNEEGAQIPPPVLPVNFKSFKVARKGTNNITLNWSTASESNNKGFTVQRSSGNQWVNIGFVPSSAPAGSSNSELSYQFTDLSAGSGRTQYRLVQTDINNATRYSEIRIAAAIGAGANINLLPNPSRGSFTILLDGSMGLQNIFIADAAGRTVRQYRNADQSVLVRDLTPGVYAIRVVDAQTGAQIVEKAIVQ